jgi:hypothetical protein
LTVGTSGWKFNLSVRRCTFEGKKEKEEESGGRKENNE